MEYTLWLSREDHEIWLGDGLTRKQAEQIAVNLNEEFDGATYLHFFYEES